MSSDSFFDVNGTLGALSIGALVSTFLFGIYTLQIYIYIVNFPEDRRMYKYMVLFVSLLELGQTICVCHFVYTWTITAYGKPTALLSRPPLSISATILLGGLIAHPVQVFFADRIRIVSEGRLLIPLVCVLASMSLFGIAIFLYVKAVYAPSLPAFEASFRSIVMAGICLNAATDLLEAFSLCYYLRKLQLQSLQRTSMKIHAIIKLTMETGLLKSLSELFVFITFFVMPRNFVWLSLFFCLSRLHSNSLLASLNSRMLLRQGGNMNIRDVERPPLTWTTPSKMIWLEAPSSRTSGIITGASSSSSSSSTSAQSSHP